MLSEKDMQEFISNNKKQEILLDKGLEIWKVLLAPKSTGEGVSTTPKQQLPPALDQLLNLTFQNIAISLSQDLEQQKQQIMMQQQAEEEAAMQEQAAMEQQSMQEEQMMQ